MLQIQIKDLTKNINQLVNKVEHGESFIITREGKPVAELLSLSSKTQSWKRKINKTVLPKGVSLQTYLREERDLI